MPPRPWIPFLALLLCLATGQATAVPLIPGLPAASADAAAPDEAAPANDETANRTADVAALDRIIGLLRNEAQRSDFVQSLETLRTSLVTQGPPAPSTQSTEASDGLIGALANSVSEATTGLPNTALGGPPGQKLALAGAEIQERYAANFGGAATVAFLRWALPGVAVVGAVVFYLFRNPWLIRQRTLRRRPGTRLQLIRAVFGKLVFDLLPWLGGVVAIAVWTTAFSDSWRDTQLFLALTTPFVGPVLVRQIMAFGLLLLGRTRGWKLVHYAHVKLLPGIVALTATGLVASLMREFAVRLVIGRNVADIAALVLDIVLAGLTVIFALRNRRTVRSLIVKGRQRKGDHATGILATVVTAFANYWHVFTILFVIANIGARLFGIGGGNFFGNALFAVLYIVGGLAFLAFCNDFFTKRRENLDKRRTSARRALLRRHLDTVHIVLQIATVIFVATACIDLWGFRVTDWLATDAGSRVLRPVVTILVFPLVVWVIWVTVDTLIEHALSPTDNFGRQRQQSARVKTLLPLLRNFVFAALSVITIIAILANIGVNVAPLLAGAGIIGIAISFGSQQLVQDVITGFFFLFEDAIAIGDVVNTGAQAGTVEGINIRTVKIRAGTGALYSVPFSQIKALENNSRNYGIFQIAVTVSYRADADRAIAILAEIGSELRDDAAYGNDILAPVEVWGVDQFTVDGVVIKGAIRCRPLQQYGVGREFNRRLKLRFDREAIEFGRPGQLVEIASAPTHSAPDGPDAGPVALPNRPARAVA